MATADAYLIAVLLFLLGCTVGWAMHKAWKVGSVSATAEVDRTRKVKRAVDGEHGQVATVIAGRTHK